MSIYLPSIRLTPAIRAAIPAGTLQLQTGQWVSSSLGLCGRVVMQPSRRGVVVWRRHGESFSRFQARFSAVCHDRFDLLSLSDLPRGVKVPASARRCRFRPAPRPRLASIKPSLCIRRARKDDRTLPLPLADFGARRSDFPVLPFMPQIPSWSVYQECADVRFH